MNSSDTVKLLRECDAGLKMGVASIDEVLEAVHCGELKDLLQKSKNHHEKIKNEITELLKKHGEQEKEPNPIAKGMSWIKTNVKMGMDNSDATVADLITDGCDMGIKSLNRYLNQYKMADDTSKELCKRLISIEEQLCKDISKYL